jgi:maltose O-acetyltransferase
LNVVVLKGVTIGHEAVIGVGSIVTRSIPPKTIAVGRPARVIKEL